MTMLEHALKARIPVIAAQTDDLVHVGEVLGVWAQKLAVDWSTLSDKAPLMAKHVYYTTDEKAVTLINYRRLEAAACSLVVLNSTKPNSLAFETGQVPVSREMIEKDMAGFIQTTQKPVLSRIMNGMSLKAAHDCLVLTIARTGGAAPTEVRRTRLMLTGGLRGLIPLETEDEVFYAWPPKLLEWVETNSKFFISPQTPHKLVPRGLLLAGPAGTGKTMAAREIAHRLKIPLYRLDIAQALNRYIGESENQVSRILALAEQESPCVVLFDEVEKIFQHSDDGGTVTRILSQILWWLSEHRSRVLTIMTTNDIKKIPPELYRPGRLDQVFYLPRLALKDAEDFALDVFRDVLDPSLLTGKVVLKLHAALHAIGRTELSHAEVSETVYSQIKQSNWLTL